MRVNTNYKYKMRERDKECGKESKSIAKEMT